MSKILHQLLEKKEFVLFSGIRVLTMILGLMTNIFIVRKLSLEEYGVFSIAGMVISFTTTFGFSWSSASILYFGSKEKAVHGNINKTFWARNIIIFGSIIITSIIFLVFNNKIAAYIGIENSIIILVWLYISVAEDYMNNYFLAVEKSILSSAISITAKIVYIVLVITQNYDVITLIKFNICSHATVFLYVFLIDKKDIGKFEFDIEWFKELFDFSIWQLMGFAGVYIINFGDIAVIKYFMSIEDVALYNCAYGLYSAITAFANVILSYFTPIITCAYIKKDKNKLNNFFLRDRKVFIVFSVVAHIVLMIFGKCIILTLYGAEYEASIIIFRILLTGSIVRYITVYYILYLNMNKKHRKLQMINIMRALLNIVFDIIFVVFFGLIGAAIATIMAYIIIGFYMIYYCEKNIKIMCGECKSDRE